MSVAGGERAYRIEDLSRLSGTTVRTIRAYTDRGLLPRPERRGRANVYDDTHLTRLRRIAALLERGYTLASIKELLAAWDAGTGLGGVLGLVDEVDRPWSDETPVRITSDELAAVFGGVTDPTAIDDALELGILERVPGADDEYLVPSPRELAVARELHAAGVPLSAISGHLRELRGQVEHISERFLEFTTEYVFQRFLGHPPSDSEAAEAAGLVRRLRPLARQTLDAELARAMSKSASEAVRRHLGGVLAAPDASPAPAAPQASERHPVEPRTFEPPAAPAPAALHGADSHPVEPDPARPDFAEPPAAPSGGLPAEASGPSGPQTPVPLPAGTVAAVRELVGPDRIAAFVAAATEREVAARRMDALARRRPRGAGAPGSPAAP